MAGRELFDLFVGGKPSVGEGLGVLNDLSYPEEGITDGVPAPAGYRTLQVRERVGEGATAFEALAAGIMAWKLHEGAGLRVRADTPEVQLASRVRLGIGLGPVRIQAPCRVVRLIESGTRRGFAYGTLAGHPETGEESFAAVLEPDGSVYLELNAVSRPSAGLYSVAAPLTEAAQSLATGRYVAAARRLARG